MGRKKTFAQTKQKETRNREKKDETQMNETTRKK